MIFLERNIIPPKSWNKISISYLHFTNSSVNSTLENNSFYTRIWLSNLLFILYIQDEKRTFSFLNFLPELQLMNRSNKTQLISKILRGSVVWIFLWSSRLGLQNTLTTSLLGVRLSQRVSWYDAKQSDGRWAPIMLEYPFIAIAPKSILAWSVSTW